MEIIFYTMDGIGKITICKNVITVDMDKDTQLYKEIMHKIQQGVPILSKFKNKGIPGKIKTYKACESYEDILILLSTLETETHMSFIYVIRDEPNSRDIIHMEDHQSNTLKPHSYIRIYENKYQYYMIEDYKEKCKKYETKIVELEDMDIEIIVIDGHISIASIDFPKEKFQVTDLLVWLEWTKFKVMDDNETYIKNANRIEAAFKFKGTPIILHTKGIKNLIVFKENLLEISEEKGPVKRSAIKSYVKINLADDEINYIPEMEIDPTQDLIISNGTVVLAGYIGDFNGCIGFYNHKGDDLPVAWIHDTAEVNIQAYWEDEMGVFTFEFNPNWEIY